MGRIRNFIGADGVRNDDIKVVDAKGPFQVIEYLRDLSVTPSDAMQAYYCSKMNVHRRQLVCSLVPNVGVSIQKGAMQWTFGQVMSDTGVKGVGDFAGKLLQGAVTGESAVKPRYYGNGVLVLEPTYRHLLLEDLNEWGGAMTIDDGLFLACDNKCGISVQARSNFSSAIAGGEGLFNMMLRGNGIVCLESFVPREELVIVELENEELRVDGNYAIAWSSCLNFTVERSTKTLLGSAASGEGLVNVYRGTGRILLAPVR